MKVGDSKPKPAAVDCTDCTDESLIKHLKPLYFVSKLFSLSPYRLIYGHNKRAQISVPGMVQSLVAIVLYSAFHFYTNYNDDFTGTAKSNRISSANESSSAGNGTGDGATVSIMIDIYSRYSILVLYWILITGAVLNQRNLITSLELFVQVDELFRTQLGVVVPNSKWKWLICIQMMFVVVAILVFEWFNCLMYLSDYAPTSQYCMPECYLTLLTTVTVESQFVGYVKLLQMRFQLINQLLDPLNEQHSGAVDGLSSVQNNPKSELNELRWCETELCSPAARVAARNAVFVANVAKKQDRIFQLFSHQTDADNVFVEGMVPPRELLPEEAQANVEDRHVFNDELVEAAKRLKSKKAPGLDGIPDVALRAAVLANAHMFRTVLQRCLDEGSFPEMWKIQKLVLLPKPGKPPGNSASFRPICLLDTLGKLQERIILNRLTKCTEGERGLSKMQFGFRKGCDSNSNGMYDGVLTLQLPRKVKIVGFADDVSLTVLGETLEEVEATMSETMGVIEIRMNGVKLHIAHQKMEVLTKDKVRETAKPFNHPDHISIRAINILRTKVAPINRTSDFSNHWPPIPESLIKPGTIASTYFRTKIITDIKNVYAHLHILSVNINKAYGVQLLFILVTQFITLTTLHYSCVMKALRILIQRPASYEALIERYWELLSTLFWAAVFIFRIFRICNICNSTKNEAARIGCYIHTPAMLSNCIETKTKVKLLSMHLLHQPVEFIACGLLNIDHRLLFSIAASVATYIVILLQFDIAQNKSEWHRS
ncbi:uncharacterized protein LOC131429121 [Malaya genurostris]|uniref:uncharacterized protein LOC131429121 n=1 Tax=Malaya genurostris TaxID=325434 RepID=UPI0026F3C418|nr:uncharacterized protein LOC131429121 [Malaya genurostris]